MIETTAWCHRCGREFEVSVSQYDFSKGVCYDECECGKSGCFGLNTAPDNIKQQVQADLSSTPNNLTKC